MLVPGIQKIMNDAASRQPQARANKQARSGQAQKSQPRASNKLKARPGENKRVATDERSSRGQAIS